jgi:hypothetical protein
MRLWIYMHVWYWIIVGECFIYNEAVSRVARLKRTGPPLAKRAKQTDIRNMIYRPWTKAAIPVALNIITTDKQVKVGTSARISVVVYVLSLCGPERTMRTHPKRTFRVLGTLFQLKR